MLSDIRTCWPPNPGPSQPQTGTKTICVPIKNTVTESIAGLHEPAWWTGLRITTLNQPHPEFLYRVRLIRGNGEPAFDAAPHLCEWIQRDGQLLPLPWPIPAIMATEMKLSVKITPVDSSPSDTLCVILTFHEMPAVSPTEKFLFATEQGAIVQYWNGKTHMAGSRLGGKEPSWRTLHTIVPPMTRLLAAIPWNDGKPFCIHEWGELVPLY